MERVRVGGGGGLMEERRERGGWGGGGRAMTLPTGLEAESSPAECRECREARRWTGTLKVSHYT